MEGPSLILLREEVAKFRNKKILKVSGSIKTIQKNNLKNLTVKSFDTWGKHFLIMFNTYYLRIHFLLFGSYSVDKAKPRTPKLSLVFKNGSLNMYACSVQKAQGQPSDIYDWSTDLMSDEWNASVVLKKIKESGAVYVCDLLLDQNIFTGAGNIIKNEVLFKLKLHPETRTKSLSNYRLTKLCKATRDYSFDFYKWKKDYRLRKNWLVYKKKICSRCGSKISIKQTGSLKRTSYFCPVCQLK